MTGENIVEKYGPLPVCVLTANFASAKWFAINAPANSAENIHP